MQLSPLLLLQAIVAAAAYKPVIMMHGVGSDAGEMAKIARLLNETHPGTVTTSLALYENSPAAWDHDLETQVAGVSAAIRKLVAADPALYADGWHMVCKRCSHTVERAPCEAHPSSVPAHSSRERFLRHASAVRAGSRAAP